MTTTYDGNIQEAHNPLTVVEVVEHVAFRFSDENRARPVAYTTAVRKVSHAMHEGYTPVRVVVGIQDKTAADMGVGMTIVVQADKSPRLAHATDVDVDVELTHITHNCEYWCGSHFAGRMDIHETVRVPRESNKPFLNVLMEELNDLWEVAQL